MTVMPEDSAMPEDPVVKSGRREAIFTLIVWLAAATYTVGYCTCYGYGRAPQDVRFVLWFPDWVFWGIVVPWLTCAIISAWFALCVMQDAPLVSDADAPPEDNTPSGHSPDDNSPRPAAPAPGGRP